LAVELCSATDITKGLKQVTSIDFHKQGIEHHQGGEFEAALESWLQGAQVGCYDCMWKIFDWLFVDGELSFEDDVAILDMAREAALQDAIRAWSLSNYFFDDDPKPDEGLRWGVRAAEANPRFAQKLADRFATGDGLPRDLSAAMHWWETAARVDGGAAFELGDRFKKGHLIEKNEEKAVVCWLNGAEMGDVRCMNQIALAYASGQGAAVDNNLALSWWERAAVMEPDYAFKLGERFQSGRQLEKNEKLAIKWWQHAAAAGHQGAVMRLERLGLK
jgi:uncharacterized protein